MKNSLWNAINLCGGKITYDAFIIDLSKSPASQVDQLDQDLIQIEYGERYFIDVGWYPSWNEKGLFRIVAIEDYVWDEPLFKAEVKQFDRFIPELQRAIDFLNTFVKEHPNRPLRKNPYV